MARRTSYLNVVQDEYPFVSGAWAAHPNIAKKRAEHILFGSEGGKGKRESETNALALARYNFKQDALTEPKPLLSFEEEGSPPLKIAVHPKGTGVIVSFKKGCKLFTWKDASAEEKTKQSLLSLFSAPDGELKLERSEEVLRDLEDVGPQSCIRFSDDGSLLASAGEDGHVRVFKWPSMEVVASLPKALKSVKDLDISLDNGFLSATGDNVPCNIWDLKNGEFAEALEPKSGERFGFSRFSRNEKKAFLFITLTKDKKGFVSVWDMTNWRRIGAKRFVSEPITSFAVTHHGRRIAMGAKGGDISLVETETMKVVQVIRNAHSETVTSLEFSPNDKALLSLSSDLSSRVSALDLSKEWKEWQIYLVLLAMFLGSILVFYLLYRYGDSFFQVPEGRKEYDRLRMEMAPQKKSERVDFGSHEEL